MNHETKLIKEEHIHHGGEEAARACHQLPDVHLADLVEDVLF
jgi:hypothetical protein